MTERKYYLENAKVTSLNRLANVYPAKQLNFRYPHSKLNFINKHNSCPMKHIHNYQFHIFYYYKIIINNSTQLQTHPMKKVFFILDLEGEKKGSTLQEKQV